MQVYSVISKALSPLYGALRPAVEERPGTEITTRFGCLRSFVFWMTIAIVAFYSAISLTANYRPLPHNDLVQDTWNAYNFVHHGEFPKHSGVTPTMYAMIPPGVSYGMIPGILVFGDNPKSAERFGALVMFAATLFGLYFWLYPRLGKWPTAAAIVIFSAGENGIFYALTLWPRGHVFFIVWFLFMLALWIEKKSGVWLCAALVFLAAGMYWFMELVPIAFVIPVLYILYRPPFKARHILAAVALGLLIWLPYLSFEAPRDFVDLRAIVTQKTSCKSYTQADVVSDKSHHTINAWEVPALKQKNKSGGKSTEENSGEGGFWLYTEAWGTVWAEKATRYCLGEPGFIFYCYPLNEWCFQSFTTGRLLRHDATQWEKGVFKVDFPTKLHANIKTTIDSVTIRNMIRTFSPLYNFGGDQSFGIFLWQTLLFLLALVYVIARSRFGRSLADSWRFWIALFSRKGKYAARKNPDRFETTMTMIWLAAAISLFMQCALIKSWQGMWGNERHFVWIWMSEAIVIGAAIGCVKFKRWRIGVPLAVAAVITLNLNPLSKYTYREAFAVMPGANNSDVDQAIDKLASIVKSEGKTSARIGYDINLDDWMFLARHINGTAKGGLAWDTVLYMRHGIANLDQSPEGLSADDEFRVFSPAYDIPRTDFERYRWSMTTDGSLPEMAMIAEVGSYEILHLPNPSK